MLGEFIKAASMWALRLIIIGVFAFVIFQIIGSFWRGVLPVILALIVCTVLAPVSSALRRIGFPDALAAIVTVFGAAGIFGFVISLIAPSFARQSQTLYLQTVDGIFQLQLWAQGEPLNLSGEDISRYFDEIARWFQNQAGAIAGSVFEGISAATSVVLTFVVVLILTLFFLKDGHKFLPWLRAATGRRAGWHLTELLTRSWTTLGGFIRAQAIVSAIDAIFIGAGLFFIGVPLAGTLAFITFLAGFIPFVGAIVAGALSVMIALVSLGFTKALIVLGLVLAVQQLEGNVLSPWLQARAMNLHPVIVLVSVTVGGALFGLVGAFLAVPVAATVAVAFRYFQDILMIQSGEKSADDVEFATIAGRLLGEFNEKQGSSRRAQWREEGEAAPGAPEDAAAADAAATGSAEPEDLVDLSARPPQTSSSTHRSQRSGQLPDNIRAAREKINVQAARDKIDGMFDNFRKN